jgi:glucuronyl/N-acetylglucosaminyl transferase EXT2
MNNLPDSILKTVAKHFNCEDIAMSFMISSVTEGQAPLLADNWAMNTMLKLKVKDKISGGKDHKQVRDVCVDSFAHIFGLKDDYDTPTKKKLNTARWIRKTKPFFQCGAEEDSRRNDSYVKSQRELDFEETMKVWHSLDKAEFIKVLGNLMSKAGQGAYQRGLLGSG